MSWWKNARTARDRRRSRPLGCEALEGRALLAADFPQLIDPHASVGNNFGSVVVPLSTGNVVVTSPFDDAGGTDAGAVYLFNGATGALISTITGSSANDNIGSGGVKALANGNYVIVSRFWDNGMGAVDAGAVTFGKGLTGISGVVAPANSLVGGAANDFLDCSVRPLANGNYVVLNQRWDNGAADDAGAATFGDGGTGVAGIITPGNSLVGSTADDRIGNNLVTELANGNYIVLNTKWDNGPAVDAGPATFGSGTSGVSGVITAANSLVGSATEDLVGISATPLANGNYVVSSFLWDNGAVVDAGAATFGNGATGTSGLISAANSLVGSSISDMVSIGITALTNGNYVVRSYSWDNGAVVDAGAATFGNGTTGALGVVSSANSLVGSTANDQVAVDFNGSGVIPLKNGNYVVRSLNWDNGAAFNAGAVTFGSGDAGITGPINAGTSLVGDSAQDSVGSSGVTELASGNYVVLSPSWDGDVVANLGAVTFASGTTGISGAVSPDNSLVGSIANDFVGSDGIAALPNGNYVVLSKFWNNGAVADAGAATFASGSTGIVGVVNSGNSLVGSRADDKVGQAGLVALTNGNYVVSIPTWNNGPAIDAGAATLGNGTTGVSGTINAFNSLVESTTNDRISDGGVGVLANGNYVVRSTMWDNGPLIDAGAATFGHGTSGVTGAVSETNSLVGNTAGDRVSSGSIIALENGNYLVSSPLWDNGPLQDDGAVTFGRGNVGVKGVVTSFNSVRGEQAGTSLRSVVVDDVNNHFFCRFLTEAGGIVRVGSQIDGFNAPPVIGGFGGDLLYRENGFPLPITTMATVSDVDSLNFAEGRLQVGFASGGVGSDRFAIRNQGTGPDQINLQNNQVRYGTFLIGTFTGGTGTTPLVVALTGSATPVRVQALLRNITFRSTSDNPPTAPRTVRAFLTDGDGEAVGRVKRITIERVNDAPELAPKAGATVGYRRGTSPVGLLPTAIVSDPDSPNFRGGKLRVRVVEGFHDSNQLQIFGGFTLSGNNVQRKQSASRTRGAARD